MRLTLARRRFFLTFIPIRSSAYSLKTLIPSLQWKVDQVRKPSWRMSCARHAFGRLWPARSSTNVKARSLIAYFEANQRHRLQRRKTRQQPFRCDFREPLVRGDYLVLRARGHRQRYDTKSPERFGPCRLLRCAFTSSIHLHLLSPEAHAINAKALSDSALRYAQPSWQRGPSSPRTAVLNSCCAPP